MFIDLANARERDRADVRFGVHDTAVVDITGDRPGILFTDADADADGAEHEVRCDILVGADGSHSICRHEIPETQRRQYFREYPFAWFGILAEAPKSAPELIYTHSERGFALISQRTEIMQRMYFQCDPDEDIDVWSEDRIWDELQARLAGEDGFRLAEGPITSKTVLPFRSFVCEPMPTATCCWQAMPPTPSHPPEPKASTWRSRTSVCWPRCSSARCARTTGTRSTSTLPAPWPVSGELSTSPTG